ncbi:MAG: ABC-F family ATP-binding cassette domain-containing protein [Firmicutes bacterium]|nr:ABC-F family ATP-binding cassette domain-containing protein [Bacillota bacterium]
MIALGTSSISVSFGDQVILDDVSFSIENGDRLAIVGVNGAGKSTLLRVICGDLEPDKGQVFIDKTKKLGFLRQQLNFDSDKTVFDAMLSVFDEQISLERQMAELEAVLKNSQDEKDIARFAGLCEKYKLIGGYEYKSRTASTLCSLGFPESMHSLPVSGLSGGQKTALSLVALILRAPDILILDEPTNHLDVNSLIWLENYLRSVKSTVVIVSHDRYFLDRTTNKTLEIENTHAKLYNVPYSGYREQKKKEREIAERHYENQQREIARLEAFIAQQRRWNRQRNIIAAESREKAIARMEKVARPEDEPESLSFSFNTALRSGNDVLKVEHLGKSFGEKRLFSDLSFEVKAGERLFILGSNGCGKSTLLKILCSRIGDYEGSFEIGYNAKIGYYDQEYQDLDESSTVLGELWQTGDFTQTEIRSLLAAFMFRGDDVFKPVSVLSGGEKARLTLAKLMQKKVNVLFLDEPTNHLDINSREALENALSGFPGTVIAVSHDRYFIRALATHIVSLTAGPSAAETSGQLGAALSRRIIDFKGGYEDYLAYCERLNTENTSQTVVQKPSDGKNKYLENKRLAAEQRKHERAVERAQARIPELEAEIDELSHQLETGDQTDYMRIEQLFNRKKELETELEGLYELVL